MIWQANCSNIEFVQFYIQFCIFSYVSNIKLVLHIQPTSWHYAHFYLIFNYSFSTLLFIQHLTILSTLSSSFDIQFFIQHSTSTQLSTIHSTLNSSFNIKFIIQHLILHSIQLSWTLTISGQWCIALLLDCVIHGGNDGYGNGNLWRCCLKAWVCFVYSKITV